MQDSPFRLQVERLRTRLSKNRTGRAVSGLISDYAGNALTQILSFLVTPLLVTLLSESMYGFWIVVSQVLFWFNLLDGGVGMYLIKSVASEKHRSESERLTQAISTSFWSYVFLSIVTVLVGSFLAPWLPGWAKIGSAEAPAVILTFRIAILTASISLVTVPTFYAILQGYQRLALLNGIVYGVGAVNLLLAVGLLRMGWGIVSMAVAQLCATLFGAAIAFIFARQICSFSLSTRHFRLVELRQILHFATFFQMNKLAFVANTFSDGFLLAGVLGTAPVTTYALTQKLSSTASLFVTKVGGVLLPGLAELFAQRDVERLQQVVLRLLRLLTRASLLCFIMVVALNERFVSLWVGPDLFGGITLTLLFAYIILYNGLIGNLSVLFFSSGQLEGWGWLSLISAIVKIGLTVLLLPTLGLLAPMVGTIVGGLFPGVYAPIKTAQLIQLRLSRIALEGVAPSLIRSLPTVFVIAGLSVVIPVAWHWSGLVCIGLGGLVTNVLTFDMELLGKSFARLAFRSMPTL